MKKTIFFTLLLASFAFPTHGQTSSADEKLLLDLESQRIEAMAARNEAFLGNLYDDRFHGVTTDGSVVDKPKIMEHFKTNNPFVVFSIDEVKATVHGSTAIITGKLISKSKTGSIIGQSRFVHVYLKVNNQWKIIEGQGTTVIHQ